MEIQAPFSYPPCGELSHPTCMMQYSGFLKLPLSTALEDIGSESGTASELSPGPYPFSKNG